MINYKKLRFMDNWYKNLLGNKFTTRYILYGLIQKKKANTKNSKLIISSDNTILYENGLGSDDAKQELLLVIPFIYTHYQNVTVNCNIYLMSPVVEDICKQCNFKYVSPYSREKLSYDYVEKLNTIYN